MHTTALILAAGSGRRMKSQIKKQFLRIGDRPILFYSVHAFESCTEVDDIVLVCPPEDLEYVALEVVDKYGFRKVKKVVSGGEKRQDSVWAGLQALDPPPDLVAIHDGVRPFLDPEQLNRALALAVRKKAVIFGVPISLTVKEAENRQVSVTIPRQRLWEIQTPQIFSFPLIYEAYKLAQEAGFQATDDAMMLERQGMRPYLFEGSRLNLKITTPEDLEYANFLLERGLV